MFEIIAKIILFLGVFFLKTYDGNLFQSNLEISLLIFYGIYTLAFSISTETTEISGVKIFITNMSGFMLASMIILPFEFNIIELLSLNLIAFAYAYTLKKWIKGEDLSLLDYMNYHRKKNYCFQMLMITTAVSYAEYRISGGGFTSICLIAITVYYGLLFLIEKISGNNYSFQMVTVTMLILSVVSLLENASLLLISFLIPLAIYNTYMIYLMTFKKHLFLKKTSKELLGNGVPTLYSIKELESYINLNLEKTYKIYYSQTINRCVLIKSKNASLIEKGPTPYNTKFFKIVDDGDIYNGTEKLINLSGLKINEFTEKENKIIKAGSLMAVEKYIKESQITYKDLTDNDFMVIEMMKI